MEYNFRDEKSVIGVGEAQVRNENSVTKEPQFAVAVYSALLMASVKAYGDQYHKERGVVPDWMKTPRRPSCRMLQRELSSELRNNPERVLELNLTKEMIEAILLKVA